MNRRLLLIWLLPFLIILSGFTASANEVDNPDSLISHLSDSARSLAHEGKYYESLEVLKKQEELVLMHRQNNPLSKARVYSNMGIIYNLLGQYKSALDMNNRAEEFRKTADSQHPTLVTSYIQKADLYIRLNDIDRAERYNQKALNIFNKKNINNNAILADIYIQSCKIFLLKNDLKSTRLYLQLLESLQYEEIDFSEKILEYIIKVYIELNEKNKVRVLINKFNNEYVIPLDDIKNKILYLFYTSDYQFINNKNIDSTLYSLNKINSTIYNNYKPTHPLVIYLNEYYIKCFQKKGNYLSVINYSENILNLFGFYREFDPDEKVLKKDHIGNYQKVISPLEENIIAHYRLFLESSNPNHLREAYINSLLMGEILDKLRWNSSNQSAEYILDDKNANKYKLGQLVAEEFHRFTGEKKYLESAFEFNERAKAYNLLSSLRDQKAMKYGGIPPNLIKQENELNSKITGYRELIYSEEQLEEPDRNKLTYWQEELFNVSEKHDQLVKFFEDNYPDYFNLKFDTKVIDTKTVAQNLRKDEVLIEYSIIDSTLFTYVIQNEGVSVNRQFIDSTFRKKCLEYYDILTLQSFSHGARNTFSQYTKLGYELYLRLIDPIKEQLAGKNLIIIPDGEISYISFESLLSSAINGDKMDYYNLPYLILDHGFSTSYSSTIHFTRVPKKKNPKGEILAFAPTYDNISSVNIDEEIVRQGDRERLIRIPGVKEEVKKISEILDSRVYMDLNATESSFKANASDYKFLHLAMHTILNDVTPLYSKLAFTQMVDSIDDGFLHTYEIYNMQLNADLAVLSSCSSGYGNLQEGEGLQSLARGFAYAGCPSILMTLWEVSDNSTVEVMERFYHYLGKGYSKNRALHLAKIDFLNNADQLKSNPFFWSSFVLIGNTDPIYKSHWIKTGINIFLILLPLPFLLILYRRYRRELKRRGIY